ncbi:MAG: hypothetical protein KGM24_00885 [Elusimicrobia bacterium]|nr:hypothetical protein [Elusimicrobiota bacterium]
MRLAAALVVLLAGAASASLPTGGDGGSAGFAAAYGGAAYAIVTDPGASAGRVIVRRLGFDGGVLWEDRWGEARGESPVDAAVTAWGGLSVVGNDSQGCFAVRWSSRGARLWSQDLRGGAACQARSVLVDGSGNVYVLATATTAGISQPDVWKIDRRGQVLWSYRPSRPTTRYAYALALDAAGDGVTVTTAQSGPEGWTYASFDLDAAGNPR